MAIVTETISAHPSSYDTENYSWASTNSSYPISNGYADADSTSYARINLRTGSSAESYIYYKFDFSAIPVGANITSVTAYGKANISTTNTSRVTTKNMQLATNITLKGSATTLPSSASNTAIGSTGSWTRDEILDAGIRFYAQRGSSSTSSTYYFRIYGATMNVTYEYNAVTYTVTSSLSGDGTIVPSGANEYQSGAEYTLTITPTSTSDTVTATQDGTDITSQLVAHGVESTVGLAPADHTTSGISSGSSYASYCEGHTAEDPSSSGTSSNMYASSGSTGYAAYTFDFSDIPSTATIENVEVRCYGHRESSTIDSTHVSNVAVYVDSTQKGDDVDFPSTSNSMITLDNLGTWTRSELDDATVRHTVGYYGGLVLGITFEVTYSTGSGIDHYTYTYTVSGDSTIAVVIGGGSTQKLYIKNGNTWTSYSKVYIKVNGAWVLQSNLSNVFNSTTNYIRGD